MQIAGSHQIPYVRINTEKLLLLLDDFFLILDSPRQVRKLYLLHCQSRIILVAGSPQALNPLIRNLQPLLKIAECLFRSGLAIICHFQLCAAVLDRNPIVRRLLLHIAQMSNQLATIVMPARADSRICFLRATVISWASRFEFCARRFEVSAADDAARDSASFQRCKAIPATSTSAKNATADAL
jgi:hypothetical protein